MLKYLAIFDPSRSSDETDTFKQLLLFHSFDNKELSLNEKLSNIGIIQGIWNLTSTLIESDGNKGKIVELDDNERLLMVKIEEKYFIAINVLANDDIKIPYQYWLSNISYCYKFFVLQYNTFKSYEAADNTRELTNDLNEYFIPFWQDLNFNKEAMTKKNWYSTFTDCYKVSELEFVNTNLSWESQINQNILLNDENYLGIKDIIFYHLPNDDMRNNNAYNTKNYGFVKNFTNELENLPDLSNWIYHLHSTYGVLSSHVLAGNAHYVSKSSENDSTTNPSVNMGQEVGQQENMVHGGQSVNNNPSLETVPNSVSFNDHTKNFLHNITLPVSFTYDTFQEVGATTGISKSMSLVLDYIPKFSFSRGTTTTKNETKNTSLDKQFSHGFLISPWANKYLPYDYKIKKLNLQYNSIHGRNDIAQSYNCLFWYFEDMLAIIVSEDNFKNIWNHEYLSDLNFKLYESMLTLYKNATEPIYSSAGVESFAYTIIDKQNRTVKSSIPSWISNGKEELNNNIVSQLIINGVDQLFGTNPIESISQITDIGGVNSMGNWFGHGKNEYIENDASDGNKQDHHEKQICSITFHPNFIFTMPNSKLLELNNELLQFSAILKREQKRVDLIERKLIKLSNGLLCYIEDSGEKLEFVIKNWFDDQVVEVPHKKIDGNQKILLDSLGMDVNKWKESQL